jgi:pilus assembly protein CpaB
MLRRKIQPASAVMLAAAVACGMLAVLAMHAWQRHVERTRPDAGPPVPVVRAARDLARGTILTDTDLRDDTMPASFVPPGSIGARARLVGRELAADVTGGEVLTRPRIAGDDAGPVASLLPPGQLAVLVPSTLPPGAVSPGDTVEVLGTFGGGGAHVETVAGGAPVLQVLASGPAAASTTQAPGGPTLVLAVDTDTASRLAYALAFAKLTVVVDAPAEALPSGAPGSPTLKP